MYCVLLLLLLLLLMLLLSRMQFLWLMMVMMMIVMLCAPSQHVGSRRATARQSALSRSTAACTGERGGGEEPGKGACCSPSHGSPLTPRARSIHIDSTAFSGLFAATAFWKRRLRLLFCALLRLEYSSQGLSCR